MRRTVLSSFLLLVTAGCVPPRGAGDLTPRTARVTNEAVSADLVTLDGWSKRIASLGGSSANAPTGERAWAAAEAGAWVTYAREAYLADPRDVMADSALGRARAIYDALVAREAAPRSAWLDGSPAARADLRASLDSLRGTVGTKDRAGAFADAELALVRADRLAGNGDASGMTAAAMRDAAERNCRMQAEIIRATRLIDWLRGGPPPMTVAVAPASAAPAPGVRTTASGAKVVSTPASQHAVRAAHRGTTSDASTPASGAAPTPAIIAALDSAPDVPAGAQAVRRTVHFAVASAALSPASRRILDGVSDIMRRHPGTGVALAGYTDWRAGTLYNRVLARKRAIAVRNYLESTDIDMGQVTLVAAGTDSASRGHIDVTDYARDRRVELVLLDAHGNPLTVDGLAQIDHERDLQVESEAEARRIARLRWHAPVKPNGGERQ